MTINIPHWTLWLIPPLVLGVCLATGLIHDAMTPSYGGYFGSVKMSGCFGFIIGVVLALCSVIAILLLTKGTP